MVTFLPAVLQSEYDAQSTPLINPSSRAIECSGCATCVLRSQAPSVTQACTTRTLALIAPGLCLSSTVACIPRCLVRSVFGEWFRVGHWSQPGLISCTIYTLELEEIWWVQPSKYLFARASIPTYLRQIWIMSLHICKRK